MVVERMSGCSRYKKGGQKERLFCWKLCQIFKIGSARAPGQNDICAVDLRLGLEA